MAADKIRLLDLSRLLTRYTAWAVWTVAAALSVSFLMAFSYFAINLPYVDEWDQPVFLGARSTGWLKLFLWQHNTTRLGLGLMLGKVLFEWTAYNERIVEIVSAALVIAALGICLWLKRSLFGRWDWTDAVLPVLFLFVGQWESILVGILFTQTMPLLLVFLLFLAWQIRSRRLRVGGVLALNLLTTFTSFGLFIGPVTPVLFAMEALRQRSRLAAAACALSLLTFAVYFRGYHFLNNPAHPTPVQIYDGACVMLAAFFNVRDLREPYGTILVGALVLFILLITCVYGVVRYLQTQKPEYRTVFALTLYSLLYVLAVAYGRMGIGTATILDPLALWPLQASRYMTQLIPGMVGLYFAALTLPRHWKTAATAACAYVALVYVYPTPDAVQSDMARIRQQKEAWLRVYQATGDRVQANRAAQMRLHPREEATELDRKLLWLRDHRLSFYAP